MLFKKHPEKFWNLIASKYAASPIADRAAYETKLEKIKGYLSTDTRMLDIGCATGTQCCDLSPVIAHATGIDISGKLLAIAEQRKGERGLDNIEYMNTTVFDSRLKPESFDLVTSFYVVHFVPNIDEFFARVYSLLKPGGLYISETACLGEKGKLLGLFLRLAGSLGLMPKINLLTTAQLEQALEKAGFRLVEKTMFSQINHEYTLFAKK